MIESFTIGSHRVGPGCPCFVIAEAGVNHNGDLALAHRLVDMAVQAGADAVKFQTFTAEKVVSAQAPKAAYQKVTTGGGQSQLDMVRGFQLPPEAFAELSEHCIQAGILFMSTPFDLDSVDVLDRLDVPAFKLPSGEITNPLLLRRVAATGRPVILSTGMGSLVEVAAAVDILERAGCHDLMLLHCTSAYPAPVESANLRAMSTLAAAFHRPVGYSDHTEGFEAAIAAVALGACCIEKHFTLDRSLPGPDHLASVSPADLGALVAVIRRVEKGLGDGCKRPTVAEEDTRAVARRSLFAARALAAGAVMTEEDLIALRPGGGISPMQVDMVVGRRLTRAVAEGTLLEWSDLA
ncbi:N-acetylneuraminate synthase [Paramagnetospirillum magneticum]|uniref:Sialic acid synthase n=1 Tax=Paramagnetospirillum magneticum (strain ATCC 700264 / AMB-1) TaxID=342108 RepID=Q2WB91_PARM1|nr:N-acetylneuraminate synthase [Paramagnetospirillum magneticum]BAE48884.1 Sialic acid synthase [Paramagnetospirillum magneticum AMB-1]